MSALDDLIKEGREPMFIDGQVIHIRWTKEFVDRAAAELAQLRADLDAKQVMIDEARKVIRHFMAGGGYMPKLCEECRAAAAWLAKEEK